MVFSSATFLFFFLPAVFILYYVIRNDWARNIILILASLFFYAFGEPVVVFLMILSIICNYVFGRMMSGSDRKRKTFLALSVVFNLGTLFVFKYAGFAVTLINQTGLVRLPVPQIRLPIGISFFTFQALSYVIDVYRGDIKIQKNFLKLMLYIVCFPQLIAGPIVKYKDIEQQLSHREAAPDEVAAGIRRFICGLSKKILIADTVSRIADAAFSVQEGQLSTLLAWAGAVCYTLQIYFDFSGYSDMAIGMGKMFGFTFRENFNYPYISSSITEFWRRWHISVSTWFKEYLYFPLGGNRKGKTRTIINKWIVFFCTGLWHGAAMTFVVWGLLNGLLISLEEAGVIPAKKMQKNPVLKVISRIYTLAAVVICFTVFRSSSLGQSWTFVKAMFFAGSASSVQTSVAFSHLMTYMTPVMIVTFAAAVILSTPVSRIAAGKTILSEKKSASVYRGISYCAAAALYCLCIMYLSSGSYSPFIYLNF